jgi:hypothetical protein
VRYNPQGPIYLKPSIDSQGLGEEREREREREREKRERKKEYEKTS